MSCLCLQDEMRKLKEQLKIEKSAWEENYMKKQDTWVMQKVISSTDTHVVIPKAW